MKGNNNLKNEISEFTKSLDITEQCLKKSREDGWRYQRVKWESRRDLWIPAGTSTGSWKN